MSEPVVGLIPFMNARLDEDGSAAKAAAEAEGADWFLAPGEDDERAEHSLHRPIHAAAWRNMGDYPVASRVSVGTAADIALHDPDRELREVAAKRARLALMIETMDEMDRLIADDDASIADQAMAIGRCRAATVAVKHDAAIWSDHPDYQQKWAS